MHTEIHNLHGIIAGPVCRAVAIGGGQYALYWRAAFWVILSHGAERVNRPGAGYVWVPYHVTVSVYGPMQCIHQLIVEVDSLATPYLSPVGLLTAIS